MPIGQPREAPHGHTHGEVLALNVAGRDVIVIWFAADYRLASAHADCRAVARLWSLFRAAVNLLQHGIINPRSECIFDRAQISAMAVRGELHTMSETFCEIVHEMICAT